MEAAVQHDSILRISAGLWSNLLDELHRRTEGEHESGVFLLGRIDGAERLVTKAVFYDDLDPAAYDTGVCVLHADAFGRLWDICASTGLSVVADAHVHGGGAGQSRSDRENPMIALRGHIALILPRMARTPMRRWSIGIYEYLGDHEWQSRGGRHFSRVLKIEESQ
jgi:hypothetical protein